MAQADGGRLPLSPIGKAGIDGRISLLPRLQLKRQVAFDSRAKRALLPMASASDIPAIPGGLAAEFQTSLPFRLHPRCVQGIGSRMIR